MLTKSKVLAIKDAPAKKNKKNKLLAITDETSVLNDERVNNAHDFLAIMDGMGSMQLEDVTGQCPRKKSRTVVTDEVERINEKTEKTKKTRKSSNKKKYGV